MQISLLHCAVIDGTPDADSLLRCGTSQFRLRTTDDMQINLLLRAVMDLSIMGVAANAHWQMGVLDISFK